MRERERCLRVREEKRLYLDRGLSERTPGRIMGAQVQLVVVTRSLCFTNTDTSLLESWVSVNVLLIPY